jgi:hypothetical protein
MELGQITLGSAVNPCNRLNHHNDYSITTPISKYATYFLCTKEPGKQEEGHDMSYLILAIILPVMAFSIFSTLCFWTWR